MDTLKLKAFIQIVEKGSFSKAAEEFSYTPSAFSHMADSLEQELGVTLFVRTHRGVSLTKQGEQIYKNVKALLKAEQELNETLDRLRAERVIKISSYASVAYNMLPEIMIDYKEVNQGIGFSISVVDRMKNVIENGDADVFIGDVRGFNDKVEWFPILNDEFVAVVPSSEFKGRKSVTKEELYPYAFIRTNETAILEEFNPENFKEVLNYTSVEDFSLMTMVAKKLGVTVTNALVARDKIPGVKILKIVPKFNRIIGVACAKGELRPEVRKFINYLRDKYKYNN